MNMLLRKIRHLTEYALFLVVINFLKAFNIDRSADLCAFIARKIGKFLPVTNIARKNLQIAFGARFNSAQIIDDLWDNFGRFIGEFPHLAYMSAEEIDKRVIIEGIENVAELQQSGQPFLLWTGHFANWDFALKIINKLYPKFALTYRKANNPYINEAINHFRNKQDVLLIAKGRNGGKDLVKALKAGYAIAMLVDQKMNDGIAVPFFGRPVMTAHAIAKLALQFGYPIVPLQIVRTQGSYFKITIYQQLPLVKTGDNNKDLYNIMLQINQLLEKWIKEHPSQWFWFHRRWGK